MSVDHFRCFERFPANLLAKLVAVAASDADSHYGVEVHALVENLGLGGAGLRLQNRIAVGARRCLLLQRSGVLEPLSVECEVVWSQPRAEHVLVGVRFVHKSAAVMGELLNVLVAKRECRA